MGNKRNCSRCDSFFSLLRFFQSSLLPLIDTHDLCPFRLVGLEVHNAKFNIIVYVHIFEKTTFHKFVSVCPHHIERETTIRVRGVDIEATVGKWKRK